VALVVRRNDGVSMFARAQSNPPLGLGVMVTLVQEVVSLLVVGVRACEVMGESRLAGSVGLSDREPELTLIRTFARNFV
jgi:hypothetical protein